jgi:uncharacterized protein (TIGR02421 family)
MRKRTVISPEFNTEITERLRDNLPVRRTLPDGGRLHIDRQLPFLIVYRPPQGSPDPGTARFVKGEASYLVAPHREGHRRELTALVSSVVDPMADVFGGFLVIELWAGPDEDAVPAPDGTPQPPGFRVVTARRDCDMPSVERLVKRLSRIQVLGTAAEVDLTPGVRLSPPGMPRLSRSLGTATSAARLIGIELRPVYRNAETGEELPVVGRALHRQFSKALQQAVYEFALRETTHRPLHYQALGRRAFVKAASHADRGLAEIASAFDLLLLVSPINTEAAYRAFRRGGDSKPPQFRYRHLDVDPTTLKRDLYRVPIERVEDPTLEAIFREKQRELSLKLDLLSDRGSARFLHTAIALYGDVDASMVETARDVLERTEPARPRKSRTIDAAELAARATQEIARYRTLYPALGAEVELRDDVVSLMVSQGNLLVGSRMRFPLHRVEALIQHEVGTHVVTHWNGAAQRFKLLASGLAGYDELQEGLAVLAEYLVGGLTTDRLRTLAGRVLAARAVCDGSEFIETFRVLTAELGFSARHAFVMAMRVHRGGGLVKDALYLRGLQRVATYLGNAGRLDTLLVGKIAVDQVPVIEELQRRRVLQPPPLRPRYLEEPDTHYRLEQLRTGVDLTTLVEPT